MEERYVYIKQSQAGKFLEFNEEFSSDLFDNIGTDWEDYSEGKWVRLSAEQVAFHEENPSATDAEVWNMKLNPVPEPSVTEPADEFPVHVEPASDELEQEVGVKEAKLREIDAYDIYSIAINGNELWIDSEGRKEILRQVKALKADGEHEMTKWLDGVEYTFPFKKWVEIVNRTEAYYLKVNNMKEKHKKNVMELTDDSDIEAYDYTVGYPNKVVIQTEIQ